MLSSYIFTYAYNSITFTTTFLHSDALTYVPTQDDEFMSLKYPV